jgi:outer membrane receptor protein involved in Fe transport
MRLVVRACSVLALALTLAPTAFADDSADEADFKFRLGAEAYQRGDYKLALEKFLESNRLVPNRNVVYNVARCYEELKQYPEAFRYLSVALHGETSPDARARIEKSLATIRRNVAVLEVQSDPPGATVFLDRRDLGARGDAPVELGLRPGPYAVLAELPGYYPARVEVPPLSAGESRRVSLKLEPILGRVDISTPGANVRVDGDGASPGCTAPCSLDLPAGRHRLRLSRPGVHAAELDVDVRAKQVVRVNPRLLPLTGTLVVSSDEPGALVEVDGEPRGFTPLVVDLPVGSHALRLTLSGHRPVERGVTIEDGAKRRVDVTLTLAEEVTAASRSTEGVESAPSSVSIISERELRALRYPTVAEALRGLPGVYSWDDRSYQALGFRGLGRLGSYGNRVLVLVDGHPLNDDWLGSSYVGYDARVGLEDVERIEVVRGPGSVLYGTNAFSGVVNLVTRKASQRGGEVGLATAESGVARGRVRANVPLGPRAGLWAAAAVARGSGRSFYFPERSAVVRGADGFEAGTLEGRYHRDWLSVAWYLQSHRKRLPTGEYETLLGDPRTRQTDSRASLELKAEPRWNDVVTTLTRLHANGYRFSGSYARTASQGGLEQDTFRGTWFGAEQRIELHPSPLFKLTLGGEGQLHVEVKQTARDETGPLLDDRHPYQVGAAYALADWTPSPRVHLSAGARLDAYSTFGRSLNPRAALIASPYAGGNTKLMMGRAFRAPSVYELFYNDGGLTQVQSPNIRPESIYSAELEHTHRFSPTISGTAAAFCNYARDLVSPSGLGVASDPLHFVNLRDPIGTFGVELGLRRDFRQGYMLAVSYSLQRSRFLDGKSLDALVAFRQSSDFRRVANSPEHLASVKGALPLLGRAVMLASRLTLESGRYDRNERVADASQGKSDPFAIWDIVLTGREARTNFSWSAGVYNAFDWRYSLPVSAEFTERTIAQAGRSFLFSGEVAF